MKKVIAVIVIALGALALLYGFTSHTLTVHFTEKVMVEVPALGDNPFGDDYADLPGGARTETIEVYEDRSIAEPESKLVLEATRGGVERLEDGRIARTYESSEAPPSQCPT